ncbi:unnamed protein product [Nezara viridula]|uniref:Serpin domain-containing protein n=1 Tax=Nezara viridula TaxID=85310 RepID=A0A9P0MQG0_NEZVI|nr:unnamed protein product [Nezara viridula]
MTLEGADGKTENEIANIIHHSKNDKEMLKAYKAVINSLESPNLKIATRMFVNKAVEIKSDFKALTSEYFSCEVNRKDFKKRPEECRIDINKWVEKKTSQKIKDLFPEDSIHADDSLVMVNAMHFYAEWQTRFEKENTIVMPFHVTPHRTVNVRMMVACKSFHYVESEKLDAKIIKLLYSDEVFSIIIFLPNKLEGLSETENKLKSIDLFEELSTLNQRTVNLMLPRFRIEKTIDLNNLISQQVPTAFTDKANFPGITNGPLNISKIIQKAFIEVNERGTEAAAATGIVLTPRSRKTVEEMKCDHPFFFQILKGGIILFQGALIEPDPERYPTILEQGTNKFCK